MSLTTEDFLSEFVDENYQEPTIIDDDEEEDNDDELGETLSKKYCLDDVDLGEFLDYLDEISQDATSAEKNHDKNQQTGQ